MLKRFKRNRDFDVSLQIKNDDFISPPRLAQRNWLLNEALTEFTANLRRLDDLAARFVPGDEAERAADRTQADLTDEQIMEDWQIPLMQAMADIVTETHGDVLEIGFGRGVSASFIQERGARSHTIVECNDAIVKRFQQWRQTCPGRDIRLVHGKWQETTAQWGLYDGLFFHTYPLTEQEYLDQAVNSVTFAAHFFPTAAAHLKEGGRFTYLTHEIDSLSREHQRLLFTYFSAVTIRPVKLTIPPDVKDAWWADSMVVVKAVK